MTSEQISIVKAFGILLMILGHSGCPELFDHFIGLFHMPLFFIMAGYCFKVKYIDQPGTFIWRRIKGLYLPYVGYGLLFLAFHNFFYGINIYNGVYGYRDEISYLYSSGDYFDNVLNVLKMGHSEQLLGGYWFLTCLFWSSIISVLILKLVKSFKPLEFIGNKLGGGGNIASNFSYYTIRSIYRVEDGKQVFQS